MKQEVKLDAGLAKALASGWNDKVSKSATTKNAAKSTTSKKSKKTK